MAAGRWRTGTRAAALATSLGLAVVAGACGGGSSHASGTKVSTSGPPKGTPLQVLSQAATATVGTARMDMKVGADFSGLPGSSDQNLSFSGTGSFDLTAKAAQFTVDLGQLDGGKTIQVIAIGNTVYLNTDGLGLTGVKPWITVPASASGSGWDYTQFAQTAFDGAQLLSQLQNVTVVGHETVKGATTTHYRGNLNLEKAMGALGSSGGDLSQLGAMGGSIQSLLASTTVPMDAWIDGQNRLRRFTMTMDLGPVISAVMGSLGDLGGSSTSTSSPIKASINLDYTLYDFGATLSISAPPADQVGPAPANFTLPGTNSSST